MKNGITAILVLFAALTFSSSSVANAKMPTVVQDKIQQKLELREQKLKMIEERFQERKASRSAMLQETRIKIIRKYYASMAVRIEAMIKRLETLTSRIESRLAKVDELNKPTDVAMIQVELDKAKALLKETKTLLDSSNTMMEEVLKSSDPKQAFLVVRENFKDIKNNLKEVHLILVKVIGKVAGLRVGQSKNVTPTPGVTVTPIPTSA
ncbi:MAG TPA: hypothetical protein VI819_01170 [Patescibacteria group bacterium]|nr:hypothetical protein [Patescibacteria group bacterium]